MTITKVVYTLNKKSGLPADVVQGSLYFDRGTAPGPSDYDALQAVFNGWWNTLASGATYKPSEYLQSSVQTGSGVHSLKFYTVPAARATLGSPVATRSMTVTTVDTGPALPAEIAVCLSYQRAYGSDVEFATGGTRPRSRDRGRLFLGPLTTRSEVLTTTTNEVRLNQLCADDLAIAAKHWFGAQALASSWVWVQFSPTEWSWDAVTQCWVDNAYDVQRRRGVLATYRNIQTL